MKRIQGFTLIEVMVTVAIVAILASIALPNYSDYVTRSSLPEATSALSDFRVRMEQFFQDNRRYPTACVVPPTVPSATEIQVPTGKYFTYGCPGLSATTFTANAVGNAGTNVSWMTYTINELNARTSTIGAGAPAGWSAATPNNCWVTKKGGVC